MKHLEKVESRAELMTYRIDCLQYANWSEKIFLEMRDGGLDAVHVTIAYHENFRETILNVEQWYGYFEKYKSLIFQGLTSHDIKKARDSNRTAIFFGFQNPSPIENDIGLLEIWYKLGLRFMQLTYNNQSLLATGCYETNDLGLSRMGVEVVKEMNRLGIIIDMSHSSERSTLDTIKLSKTPIVVSHANAAFWHPAKRNKSKAVLEALSKNDGMIGFSLYPHHLKNGSNCSLESFCQMIYECSNIMGINSLGIGSDLCQDQPDNIVHWMRNGRWTKSLDYGEGSSVMTGFPDMPIWYKGNSDFVNLEDGLARVGFNSIEVSKIMGNNWFHFFENNLAEKRVENG